MRGMKRLFQKLPRWQVQYLRTGGTGKERWMAHKNFHDPVEAFEEMMVLRAGARNRVWDRSAKVETLWPAHNYTMPPKLLSQVHIGIDSAPVSGAYNPKIWADAIKKSFDEDVLLGSPVASSKSVTSAQAQANKHVRCFVDKVKLNRPGRLRVTPSWVTELRYRVEETSSFDPGAWYLISRFESAAEAFELVRDQQHLMAKGLRSNPEHADAYDRLYRVVDSHRNRVMLWPDVGYKMPPPKELTRPSHMIDALSYITQGREIHNLRRAHSPGTI